jgi:hypothetical protein
MYGKCPGCQNLVMSVSGHPVKINIGTSIWNGITYQCPSCQTVLGCQIDPIAVKSDIITEVKQLLKRHG